MTKSTISGLIIACFIPLSIIFYPPAHIDKSYMVKCLWLGLLGTIFVIYEANRQYLAIFIPFVVFTILSLFNWHNQYTMNELCNILGFSLLLFFISQCTPKWILRAMAVTAIIQIIYTYICPIPWTRDFGAWYSWGLWRNLLRHASWMYTCMICALVMIDTEKKKFWLWFAGIIALLSLWQIIVCGAHALIVLAVVTIAMYIIIKKSLKIGLLILLGLTVTCFVFHKNAFEIGTARIDLWKGCFSASIDGVKTIIGHGIGAYQQNFKYPHPHNQLLQFFYDQGIIGVMTAGLFLWVIIENSYLNFALMVGIVFLALSSYSNSMRYVDVAFCFTLLCGLAISTKWTKSGQQDV